MVAPLAQASLRFGIDGHPYRLIRAGVFNNKPFAELHPHDSDAAAKVIANIKADLHGTLRVESGRDADVLVDPCTG